MYKINKISIIFSFLIVILFIFLYSKLQSNLFYKIETNNMKEKTQINYFNKITDNIDKNYKLIVDSSREVKSQDKEWRLEISSINLKAKISEGTDSKTLNKYIGHFENTKKENGNIGLAAHNRGYKVNYFKNIKNLNIGDRIFYFFDGKKYIYEVYEKRIILDTDWSVFDNKKNELTLITCVENKEEYRRCVKASLLDTDENI